jgi:hypothetical protein
VKYPKKAKETSPREEVSQKWEASPKEVGSQKEKKHLRDGPSSGLTPTNDLPLKLAVLVVLLRVRRDSHVVFLHLILVHVRQSRLADVCMRTNGAVLLARVRRSEVVWIEDRSYILIVTSVAVRAQ